MQNKRQSINNQPSLHAFFTNSTKKPSQPSSDSSFEPPSSTTIPPTPSQQKKMPVQDEEENMPHRFNRKRLINDDLEDEREPVEEEQEDQESDEERGKKKKSNKNTGRAKTVGKKSKGREKKDQSEDEGPETAQKNEQEGGEIEWSDRTPEWALPPLCRDKKQRLSSDPMYDPTTLHIPPGQFSKLTNSMKQYWTFKSEHFDKILFFKVGKFYELFYQDAFVGNKHLSLKWMGSKMHTGFPEKSLQNYLRILVELGFKVVVIDQTETPKEMFERLKKEKEQGARKSQKIVQRQITAVHTKGTSSVGLSDQSYMPNYLISVLVHKNIHAFSLFDHMTNTIHYGLCKSLDEFKSVLYTTRPTQLLFDPSNLPYEYKKMMTESFLGMIQSPLQNKNTEWHHMSAEKELRACEDGDRCLNTIDACFEEDKEWVMRALSGLFSYLRSLCLLQSVLEISKFKIYDQQFFSLQSMILDSQAVQHLQLFQTNYFQKPTQGSVFETIDRCSTFFGKRLLRQWLLKPSKSQKVINDRLDAVEDLNNSFQERKRVSETLKSLGDLEKLVNRTYRFSSKANQNTKAILYEDFNVKKLKEVKELMMKLDRAYTSIQDLRKKVPVFRSYRLRRLLTGVSNESTLEDDNIYFENQESIETVEGLLPNIPSHLEEINSLLRWENDVPVPQSGLVPQYDQVEVKISDKKEELQEYIQKLRVKMREGGLKYTHAKERYEIEAPDTLEPPSSWTFSSRRNGYSRYLTGESRNLVAELEELEEEKKSQLKIFVNFFCMEFSRKKSVWERFVRVIAEIDCLFSLSIVSYQWTGSRPTFNNQNGMEILGAQHPCLSSSEFVSNDIILTRDTNIMMLSGPNMGGKSTLLRTSCLLIILAQMGMRIPCESYNCHIFDRVFTRIGASDKLSQGKSTFFIEMQQAQTIINHATDKSFIIMDELGRGTSTFDGMSIAYGVIKDLALETKCLGIVSTHYHMLIEQFVSEPSLSLKTMAYEVDERSKRIIFLYKMRDGYCNQSFAFNVARAVGLSEKILKKAEQKAGEIYKEIQQKRAEQLVNRKLEQLMIRYQ